MNVKNQAKIKDGLQMGLAWLIWSVISEWHELRTPALAKTALISAIVGSVVFGLIFGLCFRPMFDFLARHYVRGNKMKGGVGGTSERLNSGDLNPR